MTPHDRFEKLKKALAAQASGTATDFEDTLTLLADPLQDPALRIGALRISNAAHLGVLRGRFQQTLRAILREDDCPEDLYVESLKALVVDADPFAQEVLCAAIVIPDGARVSQAYALNMLATMDPARAAPMARSLLDCGMTTTARLAALRVLASEVTACDVIAVMFTPSTPFVVMGKGGGQSLQHIDAAACEAAVQTVAANA